MLTAPGGNPASTINSPSRNADNDVSSAEPLIVEENDKGSLSAGVIAGIVLAILFVILLFLILGLLSLRKDRFRAQKTRPTTATKHNKTTKQPPQPQQETITTIRYEEASNTAENSNSSPNVEAEHLYLDPEIGNYNNLISNLQMMHGGGDTTDTPEEDNDEDHGSSVEDNNKKLKTVSTTTPTKSKQSSKGVVITTKVKKDGTVLVRKKIPNRSNHKGGEEEITYKTKRKTFPDVQSARAAGYDV